MTTKTKSKRIFYFDALRAMAILCVAIIHVTDSYRKLQHSQHQCFILHWTFGKCLQTIHSELVFLYF